MLYVPSSLQQLNLPALDVPQFVTSAARMATPSKMAGPAHFSEMVHISVLFASSVEEMISSSK